MVKKPELISYYHKSLYLTVHSKFTGWINTHDWNRSWEMWEWWSIGIGLRPYLTNYRFDYYDGFWIKEFTFLGICFIMIYQYQSARIED